MAGSVQSRISTGGVVFLLILVGVLMLTTGSAAAQSADAVVTTDGSADYTSIQNAVDNATDGDRIKVESGTYEQHTQIRKNITVYAPNGATIANTSAVASSYEGVEARSGFQILGDATPTISGFTLTDWRWAISAGGSEGDWIIKETKIIGGNCGVCAAGTPGDWTVKNTTITDAGTVSGYESTGNWTITDTTISETDISADHTTGRLTINNTSLRDTPSDGVKIEQATGSLTISDSLIHNTTYAAIEAENTAADITVSGTNITTADTGIDVEKGSTGDLTIRSTDITNITYDAIDVQRSSGHISVQDTNVQTAANGVDAEKSDGPLSIENLTVRDTSGDGIDASNATGNATVEKSVFRNMGDKSIDVIDSKGKWRVSESILTGGREGAFDAWDAEMTVNASYNYWGAADGPSGQFNGSGGEAGGNILVTPYYTDSSLTTSESNAGSLNITLSPAELAVTERTAITVSVTDESETPVPDAIVEINELGLSTITNASGEASLSLREPDTGDYDVSVSADGYANATETLTVTPAENGSQAVADYANEQGVVDTSGLLQAIADWRSGGVAVNILVDAIDAWRSNEPVA
jgi:hypothetical protein